MHSRKTTIVKVTTTIVKVTLECERGAIGPPFVSESTQEMQIATKQATERDSREGQDA
jgi:hypothetical protein